MGSLGGRYVEIFPSNFQEAFRASTTGCGAGSIGVDSYSPVSVRSGASFRSQPYGTAALETGGISSTHPTTPGYACGACNAATGCSGVPSLASWGLYPPAAGYAGLPLDAAAAAQYSAAQVSAAQYSAIAAAQYNPAAAAAAAAQYGAGLAGGCSLAVQYAMMPTQFGAVGYP